MFIRGAETIGPIYSGSNDGGTGGASPADGSLAAALATMHPAADPAATAPPAADPAKTADVSDLTGTHDVDDDADANDLTGTKPDAKEPDKEPDKTADTKGIVPETYEFKDAEGKPLELDAKALEAFTPIAKELGLTNEQAQKLVDLNLNLTKDIANAAVEAQLTAWQTQVTTWKAENRADKDFGNGAGGRKYAENLGMARKALDTFGSPALTKALDQSGFANHPEIVRAFFKIGQAMSEGTFTSGNAGGGGTLSNSETAIALRMFPNSNLK